MSTLGGPVFGSGPAAPIRRLKRDSNEHPDSYLEVGYSHELAHLVHAGPDRIVVSSLFEPCG